VRTPGSRNEREEKWRKAIALLDSMSPEEVATVLGTTSQSVRRWRRKYRKEGMDGLRAKAVSGRPRDGLSAENMKILDNLLDDEARANAAAKTTNRKWIDLCTRLVQAHFEIRCGYYFASKLLYQLGWVYKTTGFNKRGGCIRSWTKSMP
jgi:transposase